MKLLKILPLFLILIGACTPTQQIVVNNNPNDLLDKRWFVQSITDIASQTTTASPEKDKISINLYKENAMRTLLSVNSCSGSHEATPTTLKLTFDGCTEMCCDNDFDKQLRGILRQTNQYKIVGTALDIIGATHKVKLQYRLPTED